jgi:hypothetical protein
MQIKLSRGDDVNNQRTALFTTTFTALAAACSQPTVGKKNGPYFSRGEFQNNKRANNNLMHAHVLPVDFDKGIDPAIGKDNELLTPDPQLVSDVLKALGVNHFLYTSYRNKMPKFGWRYRGVIELATPMQQSELKPALDWIFTKLHAAGVFAANAKENLSWQQPWFYPRVATAVDAANFVYIAVLNAQ